MASVPNSWNYDKPPMLPLFAKIGVLTTDLYNKQMPGPNPAGPGVARFFSLYWFLLNHLDTDPESLRLKITSGGAPVFTHEQLTAVLGAIRAQKDTSFAQRLLRMSQHGGSPTPAAGAATAPTAAAAAVAATGLPPSPLDDDPSRSKFWDIFIRTKLYKLTKNLPPAFDGLAPIIFALYGLEQIEVIGPLIASGLDSITLGLPILGKLMGTVLAKMVSLAPIPYAGPVGDVVAYFMSLVFIMLSATMSVSRKQFGTSFTVGVGAVPIIGDNLSDAALLFEKQVERYEFNKKKFLNSLEKVSPHTADFIDYWLPSKKEKTGPPVAFDSDMVLVDLMKTAVDTVGESDAVAMIPNPDAMPVASRNLVKNPVLKQELGTPSSAKKGGRRRTRRIRK